MAIPTGTSEIAKTLRRLMQRDRLSVSRLSAMTSIPASTLYAMLRKNTNEADLRHLKRLAEAFGEHIDIFCGMDGYVRPVALTREEEQILRCYRGMNQAGQERLLDYAAELGEHPRYKGAENG